MAVPTLATLLTRMNSTMSWTYTGSDGRSLSVIATLKTASGTTLHLTHRDGEAQIDYSRLTNVGPVVASPVTVPG